MPQIPQGTTKRSPTPENVAMREWLEAASGWMREWFSAEAGLWGMLGSAFLSATLLPGSSEVVMIALITAYPTMAWPAFAVATIGNVLGCALTYAMGYAARQGLERFQRFRVQVSPAAMAKLQRLGPPSLFLAFLPLVGDALVLAAGWLKLPLGASFAWITAGKATRYLLVVLSMLGLLELA